MPLPSIRSPEPVRLEEDQLGEGTVEDRLAVRRRSPRWRRTKCLTSIVGAATLLASVGWGSVFAADPLPTAEDPAPVAQEVVVDEQAEPALVIEDPAADAEEPVADAEEPADVEEPVADAEEPVADAGTCAPDVEEPQGDPADVEVPGVTDPDDMGDPADPADCAPTDAAGGTTCEPNTGDEVPDPIENPGEAPDADDLPDAGAAEPDADAEAPAADADDPAQCATDVEDPAADAGAGDEAGADADADSGDAGASGGANGSDNDVAVTSSAGSPGTAELPQTDALPGQGSALAINPAGTLMGYVLVILAGLFGGALSVVRIRR